MPFSIRHSMINFTTKHLLCRYTTSILWRPHSKDICIVLQWFKYHMFFFALTNRHQIENTHINVYISALIWRNNNNVDLFISYSWKHWVNDWSIESSGCNPQSKKVYIYIIESTTHKRCSYMWVSMRCALYSFIKISVRVISHWQDTSMLAHVFG